MLNRIPQRRTGNSDETIQGPVQFEDKEDGGGNRASAHEQDRQRHRIARSEQPETDKEKYQPENQNQQERDRKLVLRLFNRQPSGLAQVVRDLLRLGERLALGVVLRS